MTYIDLNEEILLRWKARAKEFGTEKELVEDGIHYKGEIYRSEEDGYWHRKPGNEKILWQNSDRRILFFIKALTDDEAWDVREETGRKNHCKETKITALFYKNMLRITYGLTHIFNSDSTSPAEADIIDNWNEASTARVNAIKAVRNSPPEATELKRYLKDYGDLLKEQILNLDADIIVCCDGSHTLRHFVVDNCYPSAKEYKCNDWTYYSPSDNRLIIDSYSLSYGNFCEDFKGNIVDALKQIGDYQKKQDSKRNTRSLINTNFKNYGN